ncbi:hypothetical protein QUF90_23445 [Desulfococcaceae bacterium HSG9]|nr:hypothetical protein [Desulfococcaceae bacterium HSG9]
MPDDTYEPSITSSDKKVFSLGIEKRGIWDMFNFSLTYVYELYDDRVKNNKAGAHGFIQKPFSINVLSEKLKEA